MSVKQSLSNFFQTIRGKILGSFLLLISIFLMNWGINNFFVSRNSKIVSNFSENIDPSLFAVKDLNLLVIKSRMLVSNWIFIRSNVDNKEQLKKLIDVDYPQLKSIIQTQLKVWESMQSKMLADSILAEIDNLIENEKEVTRQLATFEDYDDMLKKFQAEYLLESIIIPQSDILLTRLQKLGDEKLAEKKTHIEVIRQSSKSLSLANTLLSVIILVMGIGIALFMSKSITGPINRLKEIINRLSLGDIDTKLKLGTSQGEIGQMAESVTKLNIGLKKTSEFAENIGKGNLDVPFEPLSNSDVLGHALLTMRNNLKKVALEDASRNWSSTGMAKFSEIMRGNNQKLDSVSQIVISDLVKYVNANQGAIYLVNEDENKHKTISMSACYAYGRRKFVTKTIEIGEGLVGQCIVENDSIYITDIPEDFIKITSGLGEASPNCVLIVPIKTNEEVLGAIELATFKPFEQFEVEFVEKIGETFASAVSGVMTNELTNKFLEESQMRGEQLRAQEEEMRQNLEELMATQEEMMKKEKNLLSVIEEMKQQMRVH